MPKLLARRAHAVQRGFSLVEVVVVLALMLLMLRLAVPPMRDLYIDTRLSSHVNELVAALMLAKSEAAKRGRLVTLCRAPSADLAEGKCSSSSGGGRSSGDWGVGWMVYVEGSSSSGVGKLDAGEEVLLRHEALPAGTFSPAAKASITFNGTGAPVGSMTGARIRFNHHGDYARVVCIDRSGRIRVIRDELDCV